MLGKLKESADLTKLKDGAKSLKGSVNDKLKEVMDEINDIMPIIKEVGYSVNEVEVELGVLPKIIPHFRKIEDMSEEEMNIVIEKYKDRKLTYLIVSSLAKAASMQKSIQLSSLKFTEVEIEAGAVPSVKLKFC